MLAAAGDVLAGHLEAARGARSEAAVRIAKVREGSLSLVRQSEDVRLAVRLLERALTP